jgi:hypothetical protein
MQQTQAGIVSMRFGLTDGQPKTLDQIGQVYGVTREWIRQIESKTMSELRHPARSQLLRDYLDGTTAAGTGQPRGADGRLPRVRPGGSAPRPARRGNQQRPRRAAGIGGASPVATVRHHRTTLPRRPAGSLWWIG